MALNRFAKYAWAVLGYNLIVIIWGAYVRASVSGDGCGSHWPLCNGEIIPRTGQLKTLIELAHRVSSGLALLMVMGLVVWAWRAYPRKHLVRQAAAFSLLFIITEALVGAGLVLFKMVAQNPSLARAFWMSGHLINTFLLLAALALTAWWASGGEPVRIKGQGMMGAVFGGALIGMLILGVSGAVTALGDTLFPASSLAEGLQKYSSPTAHILLPLRILHPVIAITVGVYLLFVASVARSRRPGAWTKRLSTALGVLVVIQLGAGALNVKLLAPIGMQLVHLLLSDLVWIAAWLLLTAACAPARAREEELIASVSASCAGDLETALKNYPGLTGSREG